MNDDASRPPKPHSTPSARDNTVLDWAHDTGAADLLVGGLERYLQRRRRRRLALASTACAVLLVAGASWLPFRGSDSTAPTSTMAATATILRPEQRTLPDGSTVDLNAGAEIEVTFVDTLRRVVLREGQVHFQVAKDARRPFVVTAGAIEVRAVGTAFAVELGTSAVDVVVTEGRVAVNKAVPSEVLVNTDHTPSAPPSPLAALDAGESVVLEREALTVGNAAPRVTRLSSADMQARLAWRVPRLKFAATPLAQVVAMFNEHAVSGRDARLVLAPGISKSVRVSGMLRADDVDSLLRLLSGQFGISAQRRAGEIMLHAP